MTTGYQFIRQFPAQMKAAKRIGCTLEEYRAHRAANEGWCKKCKRWFLSSEMGKSQALCREHDAERKRRPRMVY